MRLIEVKTDFAAAADAAMAVLLGIAADAEMSVVQRVNAAETILAYTIGKPAAREATDFFPGGRAQSMGENLSLSEKTRILSEVQREAEAGEADDDARKG